MNDESTEVKKNINPGFTIVGIGASAGGLEAFSILLKALPVDTGMAFVIIQHLAPTHTSYLKEALAKTTEMPVFDITHGIKLRPNQVYVMPSSSDLEIHDCELHIIPRVTPPGTLHLPINAFLKSLAKNCERRAIGIVLSGNGSDGTEGLKEIKNVGGFTFVQDPRTAKNPSMPESAVIAGVVDFSLELEKLAEQLSQLGHHSYFKEEEFEPFTSKEEQDQFLKILAYIQTNHKVDFNEYKEATVKRRLARRMAFYRIESLRDYYKLLTVDKKEPHNLVEDILIHVTSFFRDPEAFRRLKDVVFPQISKNKSAQSAIRIWVAGCSSGEEVYSIVISLIEYLGDALPKIPIQVFGSDISELMIEKSRIGFYPDSSVKDLSAERLKRFFIKVENGYRINKTVRDLCVFVRHDLARDPPFSKLDFITCRNVLIYFDKPLQKRLLSTFHYCLKQPGYLLLGRTENITGYQNFFSTEDKENKIFLRTPVQSLLRFSMPMDTTYSKVAQSVKFIPEDQPAIDFAKHIDNYLLAEYAPCGVLINEQMEVLQFRGRTSDFLEQPPGEPESNLLKMLREGLFVELQMAVAKAKKELRTIRTENVKVKNNTSTKTCNILVKPLASRTPTETQFLILFENVEEVDISLDKKFFGFMGKKDDKAEILRSSKLERELELTKEYLHSLNDQHQKTNDALATANEEFISSNEEFQSMNEELETAKEELQSTNEELTTVNDELQNSNQELGQVNNDLINLLNSVQIPIVILDENRKIRRFTPHARSMMNLLATDIGRSIDDIKLNLVIDDLDKQISEAMNADSVKESEVQDKNGRWFRIQIRPYKTQDNKIDGSVISLFDINILKKEINRSEWARDYASSIVEGIHTPLLAMSKDLNVTSANKAFCQFFGINKSKTENISLASLGLKDWIIESLNTTLGDLLLSDKGIFENLEVEKDIPGIGKRIMSLSAQSIAFDAEVPPMILLSLKERTKMEQDLRDTLKNLDIERELRERFVSAISHDLRTPLSVAKMSAELIVKKSSDPAQIHKISSNIIKNMERADSMIQDILDANRLRAGEKLRLQIRPCNLSEIAQDIIADFKALHGDRCRIILSEAINGSWDKEGLRRMIENLLANAIKYGSKSDPVTLELKHDDNTVKISVRNFGNPISKEDQKTIFDPFYRISNPQSTSLEGWGIGLTLVRGLARAHGGDISVTSSLESGTCFTISLPIISLE